MATERDVLEANQNKWKRYLAQLQAEVERTQEIIRVLEIAKSGPGSAPIAASVSLSIKRPQIEQVQSIVPPATYQPQNVGITQLIREYIRDHVKDDEKIDIPTLARWLMDKGCKGKYRNIYSGCHVILRKEQIHHRGVGYDKEVGFFKQVREDGSKAVSVPRMSMRMTD